MRTIRKKYIQWKDIIATPTGIFQYMPTSTLYTISEMSLLEIDMLFNSECKSRTISPIVDSLVDYDEDDDEYSISTENLTTLASLIEHYYKKKWERILETLDIDYNPIYNYYDEHVGTDSETRSGSTTDVQEYGKDITRTYNSLQDTYVHGKATTRTFTNYQQETVIDGSTTITPSGTKSTKYDYSSGDYQETTTDTRSKADNEEVVEREISGFNSSSSVDDNKETRKTAYKNKSDRTYDGYHTDTESYNNYKEDTETDSTETTTTTGSVKDTDSGTDTNTRTGSYEDETSGSDTSTKTYNNLKDITLYNSKHIGNIGNITTQKMINEELEIRKHIYIREVMNDVKEFISLPIYL